MEAWRQVWRLGIQPQLTTIGLEGLAIAIVNRDKRLIRGLTTAPAGASYDKERRVTGACAIGYAEWQGRGLKTIDDVQDAFDVVCREVALNEHRLPCVGEFITWFDEAPWPKVQRELVAEIRRELSIRSAVTPCIVYDRGNELVCA